MRYIVVNEIFHKHGINNNLSLCNYSISEGKISYSLLNYRYNIFEPALMVICLWKACKDQRGIIRMSTTFRRIRDESRWYTRNGEEIISDERKYIVNMFCERIIDGFSWTKDCNRYLIRRYRMNALCSRPNLVINRNIDCHHKRSLESILDVTDDRFNNLSIMQRDNHFKLHVDNGDMGWMDM